MSNGSKSNRGRSRRGSPEHRAKLREGARRFWARKRAEAGGTVRSDGGSLPTGAGSNRGVGVEDNSTGIDRGGRISAPVGDLGAPVGFDGGRSGDGRNVSDPGTGTGTGAGTGAGNTQAEFHRIRSETVEPPPDPYPGPPRSAADKEFERNILKGAQAAFVGMILDGAFALTSIFRGPHWRLTSEEKLIGGSHINNVALAVLPPEYIEAYNGILEKFGPVLGACLPIAGIIGKRLAIDRAIAAEGGVDAGAQRVYSGHAPSADGADQFSGSPPAPDQPLNGRTDTWGDQAFSW